MEIIDYVKYWNTWMKTWYDAAVAAHKDGIAMPNDIMEWGVLNVIGGDPISPAWKFFPEPYWGNPLSKNLHGVFINFNPGNGGESQHISRAVEYDMPKTNRKLSNYNIWREFIPKDYYETIQTLYANHLYATTKWMIGGKREGFVRKVCPQIPVNSQFVMFELCPWHTKSVTTDVYRYIETNCGVIRKYILNFAASCSINTIGKFKNVILAHGLDRIFVTEYLPDAGFVFQKTVLIGNELNQPWTVDIFKSIIDNEKVYLTNFKNASNTFPKVDKELNDFFDNRDWDL